jgi:hypothetical protein
LTRLTILVIRRLTRRVMAATALGARPARRPTALQLVVVEPLRRLVAPCRTPRGTHSNGRSTAGSRFNHPRPIPFRQGTCDDRARAPAPDAAFIGRAIGAAKEMTAMASEGRRERYLRNDSGTSGANRVAAAGHSCALPLQTTSVRIPLPSSTVGRHLHADPGARRAPGVEVCGDARRREAPERSWRQGVAALRAARRRLRWRGWPRRNAVRLSRCGASGKSTGRAASTPYGPARVCSMCRRRSCRRCSDVPHMCSSPTSSSNYVTVERAHGGRRFTDLDEAALTAPVDEVSSLQLCDRWTTLDRRPGRAEDRWLNSTLVSVAFLPRRGSVNLLTSGALALRWSFSVGRSGPEGGVVRGLRSRLSDHLNEQLPK